MNNIFKESLGLWGKTAVASILCFFVVLSVNMLAFGLLGEKIGYYAVGIKDDKQENLYEYYTADGEDTKYKQYEAEGYEIKKIDIKKVPKAKEIAAFSVTQLICAVILIALVYPRFWERGYKDRNMVKIGNIKGDAVYGLKAGLISVIPFWVSLAALLCLKNISVTLLMFVSPVIFPAVDIIANGTVLLKDLSIAALIGIAVLPLIIPAISGVGYYLGFKDFSISEKLTYKKTK